MDVKEFAIANLGKTVRLKKSHIKGMIVGHNVLKGAIIVSFIYDIGWGKENIAGGDVVILHSPLNVSFWYIYSNVDKRWEIVE